MIGNGAAGLGGTRRPRDIVGRRGLMKDRRGTEESGRWLGTGERIIQVGLMGVGVGDSRIGPVRCCGEDRST